MKTVFHFPTRILFGEGSLEDMPPHLSALGLKRPLVVTDRGLMSTELPERLVGLLRSAKFEPATFYKIDPNPTDEQVEAGTEAFLSHDADCIVALGGGSAMDTAKAIQVRVNHPDPLEEYDDLKNGDTKILGELPPVAAVATTAGTGSEVSRSAVITIKAAGRKVVIFSPRLMPMLAVCDPTLTYGLPPRITAETGMDALSHNVEAFMARGYHPMADGIALRAASMIVKALPEAVEDGNCAWARRDMMMASTMGAVAFQKGLGVVHSLAHPLSTEAGLSHGLANAIMLPLAVEFNGEALGSRTAELAGALSAKEPTAAGAAEAVRELARRIGLPLKLSEAGVDRSQIDVLVRKAMEDGCHAGNPVECNPEIMERLYVEAL